MPRGYRCIILAAVGWLILAASPPQNQPTQNNADARDRESNALDRIATAIERSKSDIPDRGCPNGEEIRQSDLCAQWKAADAAQESADWGRRTFYLAIGGTIIGFATLIAAVKAGQFAKEAAIHTDVSNDLTRDAQRAWVTLSVQPQLVERYGVDGLFFKIDFIAKNIGQTVATHFDLNCDIFFKGQTEDIDSLVERMENQVEAWKTDYDAAQGSSLLPGDGETESLWGSREPPDIRWWTGTVRDTDLAQPILLAAVFYRTVSVPRSVQLSCRTWYLSDFDGNGKPSTFLRKGTAALGPTRLSVEPFRASVMHTEYIEWPPKG